MSNEENITPRRVVEDKQNDLLQYRDMLFKCLSKWYWFVLSLLVCLGIATLYILRKPPVYTRSMEIQIKSETQGKSMPGGVQGFSDLGIFRSSTNVNNEQRAFMSPDNMNEIVRIMHLDMNYSVDGTFHDYTLYGKNLPVAVTIGGLDDNDRVTFDMQLNGSKVTLSKFTFFNNENKKWDVEVNGPLGDSIRTPVGNIIIEPNETYHGNQQYPVIHVMRVSYRVAMEVYLRRLSVELADKMADVLVISMSDVSPQRAEDILNNLIVVYNDKWVKDKNKVTESTSEFIQERLKLITEDLGQVDQDISDYKSANLIPDLSATAQIALTQTNEISRQTLDLNNQLYMARYIRDFVKKASLSQLIPANSGIGSTAIEAQITNYNKQVLERNQLLESATEQHSSVVRLEQDLTQLQTSIIGSLDNLMLSLQTQISNLAKRESRANNRLAASPSQEKDLLTVTRQQKVKESLYLFLLQKLEENEISQAFTAYNTRIIKTPIGSILPSSPKKSQIWLIALVIGLAIPIVIIYLMETLNTKMHGRQDLESLTIPFLGEIPLATTDTKKHWWNKKTEEKNAIIVVKQGERDVVNEAFRVVRTNLEFMTRDRKSNVITLTSYNVNSGKTFISMNLSIALSLKGKKVLAIDGDLRKASLSLYANSPKLGISNYLSGQVTNIDDVIVQLPNYNHLSILPVGTMPPNPTELISEPRFAELLANMRERFDIIMIDCPPIEILADTQIIEQLADSTIFVVRAGLMDKSLLPDLEGLYQDGKFKNMSLILNGTTSESSRYGSRYSYGSRYGGYSYGEHKKEKGFSLFKNK